MGVASFQTNRLVNIPVHFDHPPFSHENLTSPSFKAMVTRGQKLGQRSNTYGGSAGEPIGVTSALGNIDEIPRRNGSC